VFGDILPKGNKLKKGQHMTRAYTCSKIEFFDYPLHKIITNNQ